jgi:tripartite-type tricarboxylate transporter receptor subunit TctC
MYRGRMGFPSPAALRHDGAGTSREAAMMRARAYVATALAIALAAALAPAAIAQPYPNRPVRLIVPFPPGGPADVMARLIAQPLSATLGPIVVENRPGAGGTLAGKAVAIADPDGYTLLLGSSAALAIGPALYGNAGYDPIKSFVPVALVSDVPYVMVGAVNAPFRTAQELLAYARANPGKLTFGVPNGAPPHALALSFRALTGIDAVIVPYRGASTLITDMLAGRIHAGFETTSVMFGHLHDGKIRGLAFIQPRRHPDIPDVPTIGEAGVPDLVRLVVDRHRRAGGHAAGDRRQAARACARGAEIAGDAGADEEARRRGEAAVAGRIRRLHCRRASAARHADPRIRREGRVGATRP